MYFYIVFTTSQTICNAYHCEIHWRRYCDISQNIYARFLLLFNLLWLYHQPVEMHAMDLPIFSLQWRHNGRDGVSNHQPHDCLFNCSFRRKSKKTPKLRVTALCAGNSPVTGEFPTQMASNAEIFPFDDVIMLQHCFPCYGSILTVPRTQFLGYALYISTWKLTDIYCYIRMDPSRGCIGSTRGFWLMPLHTRRQTQIMYFALMRWFQCHDMENPRTLGIVSMDESLVTCTQTIWHHISFHSLPIYDFDLNWLYYVKFSPTYYHGICLFFLVSNYQLINVLLNQHNLDPFISLTWKDWWMGQSISIAS